MLKKILSYSQADYKTGKVFTNDDCTGCTQCVSVCPATALMMEGKRSAMKPGGDCISCGACTAVCHVEAIQIEQFYNIPDGAYKTEGRDQSTGESSWPRMFTSKHVDGFVYKD